MREASAQRTSSVRVSYLITTRNRADFLERTLANVAEFIQAEDELIVIDGGSTDRTAEVVSKSGGLVSHFVSEPDFGEANAFNKGLFLARGRYIKPITDDDYFYPEAMRTLIAAMESDREADAIQCGGELWTIEPDGPDWYGIRFLPLNVEPTAENIYEHAASGLGVLITRAALMRTGGVSNAYTAVDGDLLCRLIECRCKVRYLDVNLYRWYFHAHSGGQKRREMDRDRFLIEIRRGKWSSAVSRDPDLVAYYMSAAPTPRERALFSGLWMGGLLARSPAWRLARPLSRFLRWLISLAEPLRRARRAIGHRRAGQAVEREKFRAWTGDLR